MGRTIICGDVHGCLDELDELIKQLEVRSSDDVIMVGDLIDRGPDPVGVVRRVREKGYRGVIGNHEDRAIRWLRNESIRTGSGRPNGMRAPFPSRRREWESLSGDDLSWLWKLPVRVTVDVDGGRRWVVVHAGLEPSLGLGEQDYDQMLRIRYVDENGVHARPDAEKMFEAPAGARHWAERWRGPESVVYGHSVFDDVRVDSPGPGVECYGIDTGCVYGGALSAVILDAESVQVVQVKAAQEYFSYSKRKE